MAREGESYLDELLNAVAPDWEETSVSPESLMEDFDEDMEGEVSLEDALAILDDLPDSEEDYFGEAAEGNEFGDLLGLDSDILAGPEADFGDGITDLPISEEERLPVMDPSEDENEMPADIPLPESEELPLMTDEAENEQPSAMMDEPESEELPVMTDEPEGEELPVIIDGTEGELPVQDQTDDAAGGEQELSTEEEEPDIPMDLDPVLPDADMLSGDEPISGESVDVDDIFQDALSAVEYSGNEEEDEQDEQLLAFGPLDDLMESSDDDVASIPTVDPMSTEKKKKESPGFFAKTFGNVITDDTASEEEKERQAELEKQEAKAKQKEEKKKQAEQAKEEKEKLAQEEKERKKQLKAEKAAKKAEEKEEKKRLKEERKAEEAAQEVVGKINPVGAAIVVIFFATIGILTLFGSMLLSRNSSLNEAENLFAGGEYIKAYDVIHKANMLDEEDVLYRRIRICSQLQKELKSYAHYSSMGMTVEALDSLVKGFHHYDLNKASAEELGITHQFDQLKGALETQLSSDFGVDGEEARKLLSIPDRGEYTRQLEEIVSRVPAA